MTLTTYKPRHAARRRIRILPAMARTQGWGPTQPPAAPAAFRPQAEPPDGWEQTYLSQPPIQAETPTDPALAPVRVRKLGLGRVILYGIGILVGGMVLGAILLTALAFALV